MTKSYTIKDLEALTNIKAHTIRIWEQRYNIVSPDRTEGNTRRYSDEQLIKIMNIAFLNKHGIKISHIAKMSDVELNAKVQDLSEAEESEESYIIEEFIECVIHQDLSRLEKLYQEGVKKFGFESFFESFIKPVFLKIGLLWQTGTIDVTHEHFFSNFIRHKVILAIEQLPKPKKKTTFVLFLPNAEMHEMGLLYYNYLIRSHGFPVVYLGQSLPIGELKHYNYVRRFDVLLTVVTSFMSQKQLQSIVLEISHSFCDKELFFSGLQFEDKEINFPDNAFFFNDAGNLRKILKKKQ